MDMSSANEVANTAKSRGGSEFQCDAQDRTDKQGKSVIHCHTELVTLTQLLVAEVELPRFDIHGTSFQATAGGSSHFFCTG